MLSYYFKWHLTGLRGVTGLTGWKETRLLIMWRWINLWNSKRVNWSILTVDVKSIEIPLNRFLCPQRKTISVLFLHLNTTSSLVGLFWIPFGRRRGAGERNQSADNQPNGTSWGRVPDARAAVHPRRGRCEDTGGKRGRAEPGDTRLSSQWERKLCDAGEGEIVDPLPTGIPNADIHHLKVAFGTAVIACVPLWMQPALRSPCFCCT